MTLDEHLQQAGTYGIAEGDFFGLYGFAHVGPVFTSFVEWTWEAWRKRGEAPLYGVMRDGGFLTRLLAERFPEARPHLGTLWLSRRLCLLGAILGSEDVEGLTNLLVRARGMPARVSDALAELGLDEEIPPAGWTGEERLDQERLPVFLAWLDQSSSRRAQIAKTCRAARRAICTHLDNCTVLDHGELGLLDVGYGGNIQRTLISILQAEGRPTRTWGAYLVTTKGGRWVEQAGGQQQGFLGHLGHPDAFTAVFLRCRDLFELFLADTRGPLDHYDLSGMPVCRPSALSARQHEEIGRLQEGILAYARFRADTGHVAPLFEPEARLRQARLAVLRLVMMPSVEEAHQMAGWIYEDALAVGGARPLIGGAPAEWDMVRLLAASRDDVLWPEATAVLRFRDDCRMLLQERWEKIAGGLAARS
ncbi:hypothetical protein [Telmatospirillum sp. J64-1]|uniref:hypothetical protein n=1 Tax=Telmatospirillum sp. J64-1 TaxID=2502183 RepID=UPI00115E883D|nr:hypothetical protein [Telmatospirillum sp. J64-1]